MQEIIHRQAGVSTGEPPSPLPLTNAGKGRPPKIWSRMKFYEKNVINIFNKTATITSLILIRKACLPPQLGLGQIPSLFHVFSQTVRHRYKGRQTLRSLDGQVHFINVCPLSFEFLYWVLHDVSNTCRQCVNRFSAPNIHTLLSSATTTEQQLPPLRW